jgi:hypothetical protein
MAPDRYGKQLAPCPRYGYGHAVLSVPAAYSSARATEAARHVVGDDDASVSRRHAARVTMSNPVPVVPSVQLAPAPVSQAAFVWLAIVVIFASCGLGAMGMFMSSPPGPSSLLPVGFMFLLVLPAFVLLRQRLVNAGRPTATAAAIWDLGWYCCRCAIVYFQAEEAPPGIAPGQPLTPAQFRDIVWTAGRYAKTRPPPPTFSR